MPVDLGVFERQKSIIDQQQLQDAFNLKKALVEAQFATAASKLANAQSGTGTASSANMPAALQLTNEWQKRRAAGDTVGANALLTFAKAADKGLVIDENGNFQQAPGYASAVGGIEALKSGMERQAQKNVDIRTNPIIAGGEAGARLQQQLLLEPQIEAAKSQATAALIGEKALSPIDQIRQINSRSFEYPFMGTVSKLSRASPFESGQEKAKQMDLLRQARTDLAAPLAKQLGVNPTDKDFLASLDRIFDISSSRESREAQINALESRIRGSLSNNPYSNLQNRVLPVPSGAVPKAMPAGAGSTPPPLEIDAAAARAELARREAARKAGGQ
jgi:hypothetical protein